MKKILIAFMLLAGVSAKAQVKIGDNPTTYGTSSMLELESTNKALVVTRVANTAAISTPVNGMIIYDLSSNCFKGYQNGVWSACGFATPADKSSNGSAIVTGFDCSTASTGTLAAGTSPAGVTQTITATVIAIGTYSIITTSSNGVVFSGSGTFTATGAQTIQLVASGTPTGSGTATFSLNTTPTCSFSRTIGDKSTNGSGVVSAYTCGTGTAGTLTMGTAVSGVTQTITATVVTAGTYNITTPTVNGVYFAGSGTFAGTGSQNITLTAFGTPITTGTFSYSLNTTPNCSFDRTTAGAGPSPLPPNVTLSSINPYYIASVYDQNYMPYTTPTSLATLARPVNADASNEANTINVQGSLSTTGVSISIPYTVTGSSVSLPAFTQTVNVRAGYTEDGIARDITFSYPATTLGVGSGSITATLKSEVGVLNAIKLDMNAGLGSDFKGWLLAQFNYATNSSGGVANFQVRDIPGIPDKNIADPAHTFLYLPVVASSGRTWLNNNLGAGYSNIKNPSFNPFQQATNGSDVNAWGSLFQWGRFSDGHELMNWTGGWPVGTPVNGSTSTFSSTDMPGHSLIIWAAGNDWRSPSNLNLWQGVNGINNPCPTGFRVPTYDEMDAELKAHLSVGSVYYPPLYLSYNPSLTNQGAFSAGTAGSGGVYWASTPLTPSQSSLYQGLAWDFTIISTYGGGYAVGGGGVPKVYAIPVRCIQD